MPSFMQRKRAELLATLYGELHRGSRRERARGMREAAIGAIS